jgi:hypothetical protein
MKLFPLTEQSAITQFAGRGLPAVAGFMLDICEKMITGLQPLTPGPINNNDRCENGTYKNTATHAIANPTPICSTKRNGVNAHSSSSTSTNGKSFLNFPLNPSYLKAIAVSR